MATCKECIHYEVCKNMGTLMHSSLKAGAFTEGAETKCYIKCFKPTADVVEVKHGQWLPYEQPYSVGYSIPNYKPTHYCSICKSLGWEFYVRCPHCGAKMDGGKNDE